MVEKSNIRLTFEKDVQDKIFNIAEENMEKLKKKQKDNKKENKIWKKQNFLNFI